MRSHRQQDGLNMNRWTNKDGRGLWMKISSARNGAERIGGEAARGYQVFGVGRARRRPHERNRGESSKGLGRVGSQVVKGWMVGGTKYLEQFSRAPYSVQHITVVLYLMLPYVQYCIWLRTPHNSRTSRTRCAINGGVTRRFGALHFTARRKYKCLVLIRSGV